MEVPEVDCDNIEKLKEEITCVTIRSWVYPIVWRVKVKT
jgi:hypothetical protein